MPTCLQTLGDSAISRETCRITSGVDGDILRDFGVEAEVPGGETGLEVHVRMKGEYKIYNHRRLHRRGNASPQ